MSDLVLNKVYRRVGIDASSSSWNTAVSNLTPDINKILEPLNGESQFLVGDSYTDGYIRFKLNNSYYVDFLLHRVIEEGISSFIYCKFQTPSNFITFSDTGDAQYLNPRYLFSYITIFTSHGGVFSMPLPTSDTEMKYPNTHCQYLIFTKAKHLASGIEFPCVLKDGSTSPNTSQAAIMIANSDDVTTQRAYYFPTQYTLTTQNRLIAAYPVIAQVSLKVGDYVIPNVYKKETSVEHFFGKTKIQGKNYFMTNNFCVLCDDREGV